MPASYVFLGEVPGEARRLVRLEGPDTLRFLQGVLTANLEDLPDDEAREAALLTVKGKIMSEAIVLRSGPEAFELLLPEALAEDVRALLDRHVIMDEVTVSGVEAPEIAIAWGDPSAFGSLPDGVRGFAARHPAPGSLFLAASRSCLAPALGTAEHASPERWHAHRVATGSPAWGRELDAGFFPPEVGFVDAVSYSKGCYLGQEPLARIHARGQVNRVMVRVEGSGPIDTPVELTASPGGGTGRLTTYVPTQATQGGSWTGLAIVRRALATPGQRLETDGGAAVEVTSGPLGDDPGTPGRQA